jgi:hypothetical protein
MTVDLQHISKVNRERANRWHNDFPYNEDGWSLADWSNAMQGEAGEAGNVVKKIRRVQTGLRQAEQNGLSDGEMLNDLRAKLATEIGDTFVYLDLLAQAAGLNLNRCVIQTFNRVSKREGFPERLVEEF